MNLFNRLINLYFAASPASFKSEFDLSTSIDKLKDTLAHQPKQPGAIQVWGEVNERRVNLFRITPPMHWSGRPRFSERFTMVDQEVRLEGKFIEYPGAKTIFFLLLLFLLVAIKGVCNDLLQGHPPPWSTYLMICLPPCIFSGMIWLSKRYFLHDVPMLTEWIQRNLQAESTSKASDELSSNKPSKSIKTDKDSLSAHLIACIALGDLIGMTYVVIYPIVDTPLLNLYLGASLFSLPGFLLGLLIQTSNDVSLLQKHSGTVIRLGLISALATGLGALGYLQST